ncbi:MAG: trypsin-like peptidase domain-containing protein [Acidimicrobiia bacterium]|nr:trypsin-like peptidase domain-containing protein [Acidimicrobiia bacterium]
MRYGSTPTAATDGVEPTRSEPTQGVASPPGPRRWRRRAWVALGVVGVLAVGGLAWGVLHDSSRPSVSKAAVGKIVDGKVGAAVSGIDNQPAPGVAIFNQVRPSLVVVQTRDAGKGSDSGSLGTGVVINTQGQILTALHVVQGAGSIGVTFGDGSQSAATVDSSDPDHDIAVLSPAQPPGVIVPAVLGGGVRVGDDVYALGHPLGLVDSLTAGVVSGLDRAFPLPSGRTINGLIQFDAAVSPGNSGGPLLNRKGQVIGIVTGLANPSGNEDFVGIGFAVPIGAAGRAAGAPNQ